MGANPSQETEQTPPEVKLCIENLPEKYRKAEKKRDDLLWQAHIMDEKLQKYKKKRAGKCKRKYIQMSRKKLEILNNPNINPAEKEKRWRALDREFARM